MLDAKIRPLIDPPLNAIGRLLAGAGVTANALTFTGLALGLAGAGAIAFGYVGWGLVLILANRIADGLDGAVARVRGPSDLGGYFDIVADFAFYVSIPVGFGILSPAHTLPALVLVASFVLTGVSFLAFAVIAAKRGRQPRCMGRRASSIPQGSPKGPRRSSSSLPCAPYPRGSACSPMPMLAYAC